MLISKKYVAEIELKRNETEHYRITRNFLTTPRRMLDILLHIETKPA